MPNKYSVIGAGFMGRVVVQDLLDEDPGARVALLDRDELQLNQVKEALGDARLEIQKLDVSETSAMVRVMRDFPVCITALPHGMSMVVIRAAIEAGASVVDLVGEAPGRRAELHGEAAAAGSLIIPGCGVAPGLSNCCVGQGCGMLETVENAHIYVGGIPKKKEPPLFYQTVYMLESVLDAYVREATVVLNGEVASVKPLTGLELLEFSPPIGTLEGFYTDGLGSLPLTLGDRIQDSMFEKTLRYPGHALRMQILKDCGLLSDQPVAVRDGKVAPRDLLATMLKKTLGLGPEGDILVMRVIVRGFAESEPVVHTYELVDHYDPVAKHTAMARTTGYPAAYAARLIAQRDLDEKGVVFPEQLFIGDRFESLISALAQKGIGISHSVRY